MKGKFLVTATRSLHPAQRSTAITWRPKLLRTFERTVHNRCQKLRVVGCALRAARRRATRTCNSQLMRVIVITGGSSGIGHATARAFARRGDTVVIAGRGETALAAVAKEIGAHAMVADV